MGAVDADFIAKICENLGADFVDARIQHYYSELVVLDNGVVRELASTVSRGIGIRVVVEGNVGYSSTNQFSKEAVREAALKAYKAARASSKLSTRISLYERSTQRDKVSSKYMVNPESIDYSEKIELLKNMYTAAKSIQGVSSITLRYGFERDHRVYISSRGDYVETSRGMIGVSARLVAHVEGLYESFGDAESAVAGWEFIKGVNWEDWVVERAKLVVDLAKAPHVEPGRYDVVLDNDMVGLLLHEAFGHASEGDIVLSGGSVLQGKVGKKVASELVSIVDDGLVEGGVFVPYDDEGSPKKKTYLVKEGVLAGYLHSLATARMLGVEPTGNGRVMSYKHTVLVRQTNIYMEPRDWGVEEMIKDTRKGLYVKGRGARGGQVNPLTGAFTFTSGPSYVIEGGELVKLVKGVMLTGLILETLNRVDAVGRDFAVRTSVFGGCGKANQMVRVGDGGPHVRVRDFTVGGG